MWFLRNSSINSVENFNVFKSCTKVFLLIRNCVANWAKMFMMNEREIRSKTSDGLLLSPANSMERMRDRRKRRRKRMKERKKRVYLTSTSSLGTSFLTNYSCLDMFDKSIDDKAQANQWHIDQHLLVISTARDLFLARWANNDWSSIFGLPTFVSPLFTSVLTRESESFSYWHGK